MTPISPQEIYLLERYSSAEYFAELRDTWENMVAHVEGSLERFMMNLPPDYRSRPLPEQADIVWGDRVLPNFRDTFQALCSGSIMLSHGDAAGLHFAHGPRNDFKGQSEFWSGWMTDAEQATYSALLNKSVTMASNICATEGAYWEPLSLSRYSAARGDLNPPPQWPSYKINKKVSVATGGKIEQSGIYIPSVADSCAEFLSQKYKEAPAAIVFVEMVDLKHPTTGAKYAEEPRFEARNCVWYLVERDHDPHNAIPPLTLPIVHAYRVEGGKVCPATGFYLTPARPESRRLFQKGEVMPAFEATYGMTIWQWDVHQE